MSDLAADQAAWSRKPVGEEMRGNGFGDKARQLTEWFMAWNSCEQTIALYSLLSKVSATQARFLSLVLEHSLKNGYDSKELTRLEEVANNATSLSSLHSQTEDKALEQLLTHLPLLNPGNTDARKEYMRLLPKVLLSTRDAQHYLDQCRQLLSLALVHPAFPKEDRDELAFWLSKLDGKHTHSVVSAKRVTPQSVAPAPSHSQASLPAYPPMKVRQIKSEESSSLGNGDLMIDGFIGPVTTTNGFDTPEPLLDSTGTPPPPPQYRHTVEEAEKRLTLPSMLTAQEALQVGKNVHKSTTLPARTGLYGSSYATLREDTCISSLQWNVGMRDVPSWLKSLRLHKYAPLFAPLTYEEMIEMSEDYLERNNVTQGARKKIVLSICRLAKRPETLLEIEQDMEKHGRLLACIQEIKQMLQTPIKPYSKPEEGEGGGRKGGRRRREVREERLTGKVGKADAAFSGDEDGNEDSSGEEGSGSPGQHSSSDPGSDLDELLTRDFPTDDLPSLLSRAMGKAYNQLMLHTDTNEDNLSAFIKLLDNALQHEVFTLEHKKLFFEWKQQCQQVLRVITPKKPRSARTWGAFTIAGMPSQLNRGSRGPTRSLRQVKNGGLHKTLPVTVVGRNSSTLPRVTPRTTGPPLPAHTFRPSSTVYPASSPSQMNAHSVPFVPSTQPLTSYTHSHIPPPPPPSSSSSSLPHKSCDQTSFDYLAEGIAEYILNDTSDS